MKPSESDQLTESLVQEAEMMAKPFSPALHARVMRQVRASHIALAKRTFPRTAFRIAMCTALIAIAIVTANWKRQQPPKPTVAQTSFGDMSQWLTGIAQPVQTSFDRSIQSTSTAYLDHDAARFGRFVIRRLDSLPERTSQKPSTVINPVSPPS